MTKTIQALPLLLFIFICSITLNAQTTEFTYQGKLQTGAVAANGSFDMEFRLFDEQIAGSQVGQTVVVSAVTVSNGIFSIKLDFNDAFNGDKRFLEVRLRPASGGSFETLTPRQQLDSNPYSVRSIFSSLSDLSQNSVRLGGVNASQYVLTTDPRMSDARPPTADSPNYIRNSISPQASSNFSISGNGILLGTLTANVVSSNTQFNLGPIHVLSRRGTNNLFLGTLPEANSGQFNTILGSGFSGTNNTTGSFNTFAGSASGGDNENGNNNSFFGSRAGELNISGSGNTFIGTSAGTDNLTGSNNTAIGSSSQIISNPSFATAIGSGSVASSSNSIVLGRSSGADTVVIAGNLVLRTIDSGGNISLCRNNNNFLASCSSSLRYKTNLAPFTSGKSIIDRLQPVSFNWTSGGMADLGLGAEDVASIEPLLVTYNEKGEVEGVKYDRIGVVLINVVKDQQSQINNQQKRIGELEEANRQQSEALAELKQMICAANPSANFCKKQ